MNTTYTITEDQAYDLSRSLRHAHNYLNKMRQWKAGKIELAVPGCDPPRVMSDDELANEYAIIADLMTYLDELISSPE